MELDIESLDKFSMSELIAYQSGFQTALIEVVKGESKHTKKKSKHMREVLDNYIQKRIFQFAQEIKGK